MMALGWKFYIIPESGEVNWIEDCDVLVTKIVSRH